MADNGGTNGGGKKSWSEAENMQFMLQIINQLSGEKSVKLSEINMPGRTTKSLTHQWAKIRAEAAAASGGEGASDPAKSGAKKPAASKKRKATDVDGDGGPVKSAKKQKPKAAPVKNDTEANSDDDDEEET